MLSACETGLYDIDRNPDEFVGLPSAFVALGAAGVLSTLWPVTDTATALLMAKFYELHMGGRLAPPTALNRAQVWLREATNEELSGYAKVAAAQGRLESRHLEEIEKDLSAEGLTRSHNRALVEWIGRNGNSVVGETRNAEPKPIARPYAHLKLTRFGGHPTFWVEGVHDVEAKTALPSRVSASDGRAGASRPDAGGAFPRVRPHRAIDPQLGRPG